MSYVIDMKDLNLMDLIDLTNQALIGAVKIDYENFLLLSNYTQARIEIVVSLEKVLNQNIDSHAQS